MKCFIEPPREIPVSRLRGTGFTPLDIRCLGIVVLNTLWQVVSSQGRKLAAEGIPLAQGKDVARMWSRQIQWPPASEDTIRYGSHMPRDDPVPAAA